MEEEFDFWDLADKAVMLALDDSVDETGICADFFVKAVVKQTGELDCLVHGLDGEGDVARGEREGGEIVVEPDIGGIVAQTNVEFLCGKLVSTWWFGLDSKVTVLYWVHPDEWFFLFCLR